ncbi:Peptidase family M50 [Fragilaria crotonensis]|nr:Peptidase family M50 [Fragilaria crotonensis]
MRQTKIRGLVQSGLQAHEDLSFSAKENSLMSLQEALELKKRARELMADARAMEAELSYLRSSKALDIDRERDAIIEELFSNKTVLVTKLRDEHWSPEKLLPIVERLHQRLRRSMGRAPSRNTNIDFQIADTRNTAGEINEDERIRLTFYLADLLAAAQKLDEETARGENPNTRWNGRVATMLESKLKELQRGTEVKADRAGDASSINRYAQQSLGMGETHATFFVETPRWLPPTFAYYLDDPKKLKGTKLSPGDISVIQNEVLAGSKFFCSSVELSSTAAYFAGSLRNMNSLSPENYTSLAFSEIEERLEKTGVSERVQLFLIADTKRFAEGRGVAILAIPSTIVPAIEARYPVTSILACALAAATTATYAVSCFALNPTFFDAVMNQRDISPQTLLTCAPIFVGVIGIQVIHELAHRITAKRRMVELGLPVPLLSPELGLCGAVTSYRSFPPNLDSLFDISISGPLSGMIASVGCIIGGIVATLNSSAAMLTTFPVVPIALLKGSFLTGAIVSILAPKLMVLPIAQPIPVHPAVCIGFAGLISNAINMLPIVGLDGGGALAAIVGRGRAFVASAMCTITLALSFLQGNDSSLFPSLGIIYAFARLGRKPWLVRNEVPQVNDARIMVYFAAFVLALLALVPFPGGQGFL